MSPLTPRSILEDLVRIDSRSPGPLAAPVAAGAATEEPLARHLAALLAPHGFLHELQWAAPGRPNLVAWSGAWQPGRAALAFEAHLDTVGADGMSHPPFEPRIRAGRLYGRGACDTKGAMAAMLAVLLRLAAEKLPLNLVFIGSCAEETGCEGIRHVDLTRFGGARLPVIAGEPTELRPITGHKAHAWFEWAVRGRAAHGSVPETGDNAIVKMTRVIQALEVFAAGQLREVPVPAGFTPPTLSIGVIRGGVKENVVPDYCSIQADLRLMPGQNPDAVVAAAAAFAEAQAGIRPETVWLRHTPALATPPDSPLLRALADACAETGTPAIPGIVNFCTDAGVLQDRGHDTLVFGPGSILRAHGSEEYLELDQFDRAAEILALTARRLAGTARELSRLPA